MAPLSYLDSLGWINWLFTWNGLQGCNGFTLIPHELLEHGRIPCNLHSLPEDVGVVEHLVYFRVTVHQL